MRRQSKKMVITSIILVAIVVGIQAESTVASFTRQTISIGKLVGMVRNGAGARITVEGAGLKREIIADSSGHYEAELAPGLYRISAVMNNWDYPFKRAAFRLRPGETTMINIVPAERILEIDTQVIAEIGFRDNVKTIPPPGYDSFSTTNRSRLPLDLLARYSEKQNSGNYVEYKEAMVSYDALSIYADRIRLDKNTFRVEASGNDVLVEDGKQRIRVKKATLDFKSGEPVISLEKGAIEKVRGDGSFNTNGVTFRLSATRDSAESLDPNTDNQLYYSDIERGINLTSNWYYVIVTNDKQNTLMLKGTACVERLNLPLSKTADNKCVPVGFIASIYDGNAKGERDKFSITVEGLIEYSRGGTLSNGNIQITRKY
jgi:hypothetical protein